MDTIPCREALVWTNLTPTLEYSGHILLKGMVLFNMMSALQGPLVGPY